MSDFRSQPLPIEAPTLLALEAREAGYKKRIEELEGALRHIAKDVYTDGRPTKAARICLAALQPKERLK